MRLPACPSYSASEQIITASWHDCLLRDAGRITTELWIFGCHREVAVQFGLRAQIAYNKYSRTLPPSGSSS